MQFHKVELLEWLKLLPEPEVNLSTSGMPSPAKITDLYLDPSEVPLTGANQYGYAPLKEALAQIYGVTPDNIAVTPGTSMANFAVFAALTSRIGRVVVEHPAYEPFVRFPHTFTCGNIQRLPRRWEDGFRIPLKELKAYCDSPFILLLSNLHNPSGKAESAAHILKAAEMTAKAGGWTVIDEVFLPFLRNWQEETSAGRHERIVTTGSLTKSWGFGSARVGWVIAAPDVIREVRQAMDNCHVVQPFITEFLAYQFLTHPQLAPEYLTKARRVSQTNLKLVIASLEETRMFEWMKPDGGISMWVRFKDGRNASPFCKKLLREKKTLVVPGYYFGVEEAFRISFGIDPNKLQQGLSNIADVVKLSG